MKTLNFPNKIIISTLILSSSLFCATSQAALWSEPSTGLIFDDVSNVTWISDGYAFTNNIASTTTTPAADPYTGPLLGTVVTPSLGSPHTIIANDISYNTGLVRWVGSWWGATAWADSYTYQAGSQTFSDWRLPTSTEAQNLIAALGTGFGVKPPFTWVPPFYWTSNLTNGGANADVARPAAGTVDNFTLMNGDVPRYSNVWAVASGNLTAVPIPAAIWLFGGAMAGLIGFGRRKSA